MNGKYIRMIYSYAHLVSLLCPDWQVRNISARMPISSGALGWPNSYFRKHDGYDDTKHDGPGTGSAAPSYAWTVQLTGRDEYEGWRKDFNEKEAKRLYTERKKKQKKRKKEIQKQEKEKLRDPVEEVFSRQRRRRCLVLSLGLTMVFSGVMFGAIALYTSYLEEDTLGPPLILERECEGNWRTHYLGYNIAHANGTTSFNCCYLPDVNVTYKRAVLRKPPIWPDGFVVPQDACTGSRGPCKYYETNNLFETGTPPCSFARPARGTRLVLLIALVARSFYIC
ncbi:hypothetical protein RRG08_004043 [Elysia crispata]|uniref:Uncharacterized protein n=1 Tax=Elysia crispata TaxID=231223 RepID=A0AAE1E0L7_9GAST|nr:hypothetical protein RRG08_004043 [Elysia crispata]